MPIYAGENHGAWKGAVRAADGSTWRTGVLEPFLEAALAGATRIVLIAGGELDICQVHKRKTVC